MLMLVRPNVQFCFYKEEDGTADTDISGLVGVIEDARFKRKEALADLAKVVTSK